MKTLRFFNILAIISLVTFVPTGYATGSDSDINRDIQNTHLRIKAQRYQIQRNSAAITNVAPSSEASESIEVAPETWGEQSTHIQDTRPSATYRDESDESITNQLIEEQRLQKQQRAYLKDLENQIRENAARDGVDIDEPLAEQLGAWSNSD